MANRFTFPRETAFDANGNPLSGATLHFYNSGTTRPADTFADSALTVPNANPAVADSAGRFGDIFLLEQDYKVILKTAAGVTVWSADPVSGTAIVSGDDFAPGPQNPADMTIRVGPGRYYDSVARARMAPGTRSSPVMVAPAVNPRCDIVYIDRLSGALGVATGAEAASPADPILPDGKLPVARVRLAPAATEITADLIDDERELGLLGAGSAAVRDTGTAVNQIPLLAAGGALPGVVGSFMRAAQFTPGVVMTAADAGTAFVIDTVGAARTASLPDIAGVAEGWSAFILCSGANAASVRSSAGDGAALLAGLVDGQTVAITRLNGAWKATIKPGVDIQIFAVSGTWTKKPGAKMVYYHLVGGGGGGGQAAATRGGGGGGGAGATGWLDASSLGATETVTIGAGGSPGSPGGQGGATSLGTAATAYGGGGGDSTGGGGGGGGGGGVLGAGTNAPSSAGGTGGSPGGSPGGAVDTALTTVSGNPGFGGAGGAGHASTGSASKCTGADGLSGAGGSGSNVMGSGSYRGGNSVWGGGGGCGSSNGATGTGGISRNAGNGATGTVNTAGLDGNAPGGGGGGSLGAAATGKGGDGRAMIVTFFD